MQSKSADIFVKIDHDDIYIFLRILDNRTGLAAFSTFHSLRISIFDACVYVIGGCGSNLAAERMKEQLTKSRLSSCRSQLSLLRVLV